MSGTVNKVVLIGNTGDDVKMHYFENGNCVGRFPLTTSETYTNRSGERVTTTEWHNIVVHNKAAEICEKYLKKGDKVYIEGKIRTRKWQDDKGVDRYSMEILCREFTFLSPKDGGFTSNSGQPQGNVQQNSNQASAEDSKGNEGADDLPF